MGKTYHAPNQKVELLEKFLNRAEENLQHGNEATALMSAGAMSGVVQTMIPREPDNLTVFVAFLAANVEGIYKGEDAELKTVQAQNCIKLLRQVLAAMKEEGSCVCQGTGILLTYQYLDDTMIHVEPCTECNLYPNAHAALEALNFTVYGDPDKGCS